MYQNQFISNPQTGNPYEQNLAVVKEYFKKPIVLGYAILSSIAALASLVMTFFLTANENGLLSSLLNALYENSDLSPYEYERFFSYFNSNANMASMIIQSIISMVPTILIIVSFFIMYFKSKNPSPLSSPSVGFTINWVFSIISLVSVIFITFIITLVMVILMIAMGSTDETTAFVLFLILLPILLVVFGVIIFYSVNQVRFYGSLRKSISTLYLQRKGAGPFGVLSIILGVFTLVNILPMPFMASIMNEALPGYNFESNLSSLFYMTMIPGILSAVQQIVLGIIAIGYNNHIKQTVQAFRPVNPVQNMYQNQPAADPYTYHPSANYNSGFTLQQPAAPSAPVNEPPVQESQAVPAQPPESASPEVLSQNTQNDITNEIDSILEETEPLTETMPSFCTNCGTALAEGSVFCTSCGTKLS